MDVCLHTALQNEDIDMGIGKDTYPLNNLIYHLSGDRAAGLKFLLKKKQLLQKI